MSSRKRVLIIAAILLGALIISLAVNLIITLVQKNGHPKKYEEYVEKYAPEYNVPEYVIYAVINVESGFELIQASPDVLKLLSSDKHFDEKIDLDSFSEPETSIRYGTHYLRYLFDKYHKWDVVFAALYAGEEQVSEWLDDGRYSSDRETLKKIPDSETRGYVKKVNKSIEYYKDTYYRNGVSVK